MVLLSAKSGAGLPDLLGRLERSAGLLMEEGAMAMPAFFSVALTDVATDTDFTLADLKGKVVLLEPFAQWCPTCLAQQREVARLHQLVGPRGSSRARLTAFSCRRATAGSEWSDTRPGAY